jgi:SAM-dependent methyltransferase
VEPETHWQTIWTTRTADQVSWFEREPSTSLGLIRAVAPDNTGTIVDVGGGASLLVDHLLDQGQRGVIVLDVSAAALDQARERLGERQESVTWLVGDARFTRLPQKVDVWHDRAVFHFLTDPADRGAYLESLRGALRVGGYVVIATFGPGGPEQCSGLPVERYDCDKLTAFFGAEFQLVRCFEQQHMTPGGTAQEFTYAVFRRLGTQSLEGGEQ